MTRRPRGRSEGLLGLGGRGDLRVLGLLVQGLAWGRWCVCGSSHFKPIVSLTVQLTGNWLSDVSNWLKGKQIQTRLRQGPGDQEEKHPSGSRMREDVRERNDSGRRRILIPRASVLVAASSRQERRSWGPGPVGREVQRNRLNSGRHDRGPWICRCGHWDGHHRAAEAAEATASFLGTAAWPSPKQVYTGKMEQVRDFTLADAVGKALRSGPGCSTAVCRALQERRPEKIFASSSGGLLR